MTPCPTCADHASVYVRGIVANQQSVAVQAKAEYETHVAVEHLPQLKSYHPGCVNCREWELVLRRVDDSTPEVTAALSHGLALHLAEHWLRNSLRFASGLPLPDQAPATAAS